MSSSDSSELLEPIERLRKKEVGALSRTAKIPNSPGAISTLTASDPTGRPGPGITSKRELGSISEEWEEWEGWVEIEDENRMAKAKGKGTEQQLHPLTIVKSSSYPLPDSRNRVIPSSTSPEEEDDEESIATTLGSLLPLPPHPIKKGKGKQPHTSTTTSSRSTITSRHPLSIPDPLPRNRDTVIRSSTSPENDDGDEKGDEEEEEIFVTAPNSPIPRGNSEEQEGGPVIKIRRKGKGKGNRKSKGKGREYQPHASLQEEGTGEVREEESGKSAVKSGGDAAGKLKEVGSTSEQKERSSEDVGRDEEAEEDVAIEPEMFEAARILLAMKNSVPAPPTVPPPQTPKHMNNPILPQPPTGVPEQPITIYERYSSGVPSRAALLSGLLGLDLESVRMSEEERDINNRQERMKAVVDAWMSQEKLAFVNGEVRDLEGGEEEEDEGENDEGEDREGGEEMEMG